MIIEHDGKRYCQFNGPRCQCLKSHGNKPAECTLFELSLGVSALKSVIQAPPTCREGLKRVNLGGVE